MRILSKSGPAVLTTLALAAATVVAACDTVKTNLLEATNPTIIDPGSVQSAPGAIAVRNGALARLRTATADGESTWLFGGLLVDEWATSSTFVQNDETDQRSIQLNNATINTELRALYRVRTDANQAIALLQKWRPTPTADIGEMYFARGFAELQLASDFCNGIPLSDGADAAITLGKPLPVKDVFAAASASFDTAMTLSSGTDAASLQVNRASRIAKARALLGLGLSNAAAAAALVNGIATTYRYDVTASLTGGNNILWSQPASSNRYTISDSVQGNGRSITVLNAIPFLSAHDPRVPAHYKIASNGRDSVKSQDGNTYVIQVDSLWGQTSATALVSGLDARLIEAEAAQAAGNAAGMLSILNSLRATQIQLTAPSPTATGTHPGWTTPVMSPLTDPGTDFARVSLLFREKAFWEFGRGYRLGDLRRLIRDYGRKADGSDAGGYPIGPHFKGGVFGKDLNLPVTTDEQTGNPNFSSCLDRNA
jgi:starch-binding outer membrane protein, SusD/RagB family